tara:strand:+ start:1463 stop:1717 length:255 start_codon:yes stop_codon:yes gene_type:complete
MRNWWTDEMKQEWQPPQPGDLVHLIGSTGEACGSPGLVMKTFKRWVTFNTDMDLKWVYRNEDGTHRLNVIEMGEEILRAGLSHW